MNKILGLSPLVLLGAAGVAWYIYQQSAAAAPATAPPAVPDPNAQDNQGQGNDSGASGPGTGNGYHYNQPAPDWSQSQSYFGDGSDYTPDMYPTGSWNDPNRSQGYGAGASVANFQQSRNWAPDWYGGNQVPEVPWMRRGQRIQPIYYNSGGMNGYGSSYMATQRRATARKIYG